MCTLLLILTESTFAEWGVCVWKSGRTNKQSERAKQEKEWRREHTKRQQLHVYTCIITIHLRKYTIHFLRHCFHLLLGSSVFVVASILTLFDCSHKSFGICMLGLFCRLFSVHCCRCRCRCRRFSLVLLYTGVCVCGFFLFLLLRGYFVAKNVSIYWKTNGQNDTEKKNRFSQIKSMCLSICLPMCMYVCVCVIVFTFYFSMCNKDSSKM